MSRSGPHRIRACFILIIPPTEARDLHVIQKGDACVCMRARATYNNDFYLYNHHSFPRCSSLPHGHHGLPPFALLLGGTNEPFVVRRTRAHDGRALSF
uniref:Putative secreted peptide n=1 Tax=Anopheles braziliensis TaxID=58242 RepID=A0A2M3ZU91_9DIPT